MPSDDVVDEINRWSREFCERIAAQLEIVERARQQLGEACNESNSNAALRDIRARAHHLAGSGGIFGLPEVSEAAAPLEEFIDAIVDRGATISEAQGEDLDHLIETLRNACSRAVVVASDPA
ncbi:MAG: Hpt domain-containing protein [Gammaproteobacteria bacterium]|nr:Hpt domain-containing protein [Gammaproteobacteria bacterium]